MLAAKPNRVLSISLIASGISCVIPPGESSTILPTLSGCIMAKLSAYTAPIEKAAMCADSTPIASINMPITSA